MLTHLLSILLWLLIVEILTLGLLPVWCRIFQRSPENLLGISRILSLFSFGWLSWILSEYAGVPYQANYLFLLLALCLAFGHFTLRLDWPSWRFFLFNFKKSGYISYAISLAVYLAYRFYNPEIYWGEKPLEFSLFNYFARETQLPAEHPWAAGENMSYYYLGFYFLGILQKISGLDPSIGFNLSLSFIAAALFCAYDSIFKLLGFGALKSFLFSALIVYGSSLNPVYLLLESGAEINFDLFWATSRNFNSPAFSEYPIWSLLFADLHAHVIAMPLVVCILAISWLSLSDKNYPGFSCCGFFWGLLYSINGWDFVTVALALALIVTFFLANNFKIRTFANVLLAAICIAAGALITFLPFKLAQKQIYSTGWGWVVNSEFNKLEQIFLHFGGLLGILICCFLGLISFKKDKIKIELPLSFSFLLPALIAAVSMLNSDNGQPWSLVIARCLLIIFACFTYFNNNENQELRFAACLIIVACSLLTLIDCMYLIDRMNSVFKGYQIIWPLFGIAACIYLSALSGQINTNKVNLAYLCYSFSFIFISLSAAGSFTNIKAMLTTKRTSNDNFSLLGSTYLDKDEPDEATLIRWLQSNVSGKAYILEAFGPPYQEYGRVVMHTGMPTLLGWEHHTKQGGATEKEVNNRIEDIKEIYSTSSLEKASALIRYYGIDFIFVGKLEKQQYPASGFNKFADNPEHFIPLVAAGKYVLYLSKYSAFNYIKNESKFSARKIF